MNETFSSDYIEKDIPVQDAEPKDQRLDAYQRVEFFDITPFLIELNCTRNLHFTSKRKIFDELKNLEGGPTIFNLVRLLIGLYEENIEEISSHFSGKVPNLPEISSILPVGKLKCDNLRLQLEYREDVAEVIEGHRDKRRKNNPKSGIESSRKKKEKERKIEQPDFHQKFDDICDQAGVSVKHEVREAIIRESISTPYFEVGVCRYLLGLFPKKDSDIRRVASNYIQPRYLRSLHLRKW